MPKKSDLPLQATAVKLVAGDTEILKRFYPQVGYNIVIRTLVHNFARKLLERESREGLSHADTADLAADIDISELAPGGS